MKLILAILTYHLKANRWTNGLSLTNFNWNFDFVNIKKVIGSVYASIVAKIPIAMTSLKV